MKNTIIKISAVAFIALISFSCSKVQYASFGGGPKKLTALPSRNYYAQEQSPAKPIPSKVAAVVQEQAAMEIQQSLNKLEKKAPAIASGKNLNFVEKVAIAREVNKIKKNLAKIEKVSTAEKNAGNGKSQIVALILALVIGGLGIHRFYLGYTTEGIIQLLTAGGCGIWALIDLIRIAMGDLKPKGGDYDQKF